MQDLDVDFDVENMLMSLFFICQSVIIDHWSLVLGLLDLFRPNGYRYLKFNSFSILVTVFFFYVLWYGNKIDHWRVPALALPILQALPRGHLAILAQESCPAWPTRQRSAESMHQEQPFHTALADLRLRFGLLGTRVSHLNKPHHAMAVEWSKQARQEMEHGALHVPDILVKDISALWKTRISAKQVFVCCCGVGFFVFSFTMMMMMMMMMTDIQRFGIKWVRSMDYRPWIMVLVDDDDDDDHDDA